MTTGSQPLPPYITPRGRDLRIDLLRGYFVFAMVVDHVRGASPLWLLTGGNRFFTGAAEGFILTSGLVTGLVYGRLIKRDGLGRSFMKVLSRAFTLYLLTLALTLVLLPLSELLDLPWAQGVDARDPISVVVSIVTLHRTYYLVDVMLLYTVLFLLAPLALALIDQGKRWWVLGASWLLWGLFQIWPDYSALPWPIAGNYLFSFSAWQVIFFSGLVLGYGRASMPVPRPRTARLLLALTGVVLLSLIVLFFVAEPPTAAMPAPLGAISSAGHDLRVPVENLFLDKVNERPGRLLATGVTFTFLFLAVTVFWQPVRRALGWLLLPLGQHALYAYTAHVGLVVLAALALAPFKLASSGLQWLNALIQIAGVALIWVLVRFQVLAPTPRTQPFYKPTPILFATLAVVALYLDPSPAYPGLREPAVAAQPVSRFGTPLPPDAGKARPTLPVSRFGTPLPLPTGTPTPAIPVHLASRFGVPSSPHTGTPTPAMPAQLASRFSTPPSLRTGKATPTPAASATASPSPTPQPSPTPDPAQAIERVAPWVGTINGTLEEHWFYSDVLGREMPYWAYLPPDYQTADRRYPVIYLLHGASGHRDEWIDFGVVAVADREMSNGAMMPMIIILPQGDTGFWVNNVGDGPRWGDYVTQDLITQVDNAFRTLPEPGARAIGGLSMGGFGALSLAFTHPETYGVAGAHCPSLHIEGVDVNFLGTGDEYAQRDPISLAGTLSGLERLRIWIDIDAEDPWLDRAQQLHDILAGRSIGHNWYVFPGSHIRDYWTTHVIDYLRFYADALAPH